MLKRILSALVNVAFLFLMTVAIWFILFEVFGFKAVPQSWMQPQQMADGTVSLRTDDMLRAMYLWSGLWLTACGFVMSFLLFISWTVLDITPGKLLFHRTKPKVPNPQR